MGASSTGGRSTGQPGIGQPEAVDPVDFGKRRITCRKASAIPMHEHADNEGIEAWIGEECRPDLPIEHDHDERAQDEEHQHPDEKNPG